MFRDGDFWWCPTFVHVYSCFYGLIDGLDGSLRNMTGYDIGMVLAWAEDGSGDWSSGGILLIVVRLRSWRKMLVSSGEVVMVVASMENMVLRQCLGWF